MQAVQTAIGTVPFDALGRTLIHEHVHVAMPGWQYDPKSPKYLRADLIARAVDKLQEIQAYGCSTIVDPCPIDLGRDVEFVAEVAQKSGMNIIVATGVYTENEGIPLTFRMMPPEDVLELYLREITEGIGETGIKAGVIKIASGEHADNPYEARMIGIAAEVSRLTGVPLVSHTHLATHGHNQLDVIERHGGCAKCTVVGHSGDRDDPDYQNSLAERGAYLGLDRFGLEMVLPDDTRIKNLMQLVAAGHGDRILVAHDHALCLQGRIGPMMAEMEPNWRLTRIFDYVLPQLKLLGLPDAEIDRILIENPRSLFRNAAAQLTEANQRSAEETPAL